MIKYYKTFKYDYNKSELLDVFYSSNKVKKLAYLMATDLPVDKLPCMNVFKKELHIDEYGLAELVVETGLHTNPRNNGLIIFPVSGLIQFDFLECKIEITGPTMINGRILHTYLPIDSPSIFFAIKIPSTVSWEQAINLI